VIEVRIASDERLVGGYSRKPITPSQLPQPWRWMFGLCLKVPIRACALGTEVVIHVDTRVFRGVIVEASRDAWQLSTGLVEGSRIKVEGTYDS
jgi:hypothetical protein